MNDMINLLVVLFWTGALGWTIYTLGYESGQYHGWKKAREEQREREEKNDQLQK